MSNPARNRIRSGALGLLLAGFILSTGCKASSSFFRKDFAMAPNPNASTIYAGRLTLQLPDQAAVQIDGADYNGVQITEPSLSAGVVGAPVPRPVAELMDEQWKLHLQQLDSNFGPDKPVILNRDSIDRQRAILYRVLPGSSPGPQDSVVRELWTLLNGHVIQLSVKGFYREQTTLQSLLTQVLHAMQPITGTAGADVFVAPGCYVHLPPPQGESVHATVRIGNRYDLRISTDVLNRPEPPDVRERVASGVIPGFAKSQQVLSGAARAGSLNGEQAAVRLIVGKDTVYVAEFGYGGTQTGDPLQPTTSLRLSVTQGAPAVTEAEFLATWRAVLAGLSVRGSRVR